MQDQQQNIINPPQKHNHIKRTSITLELDQLGNLCYIYLPPFSSKNRPAKISRTRLIETPQFLVNIDWAVENGKMCGIEISGAAENLDLGWAKRGE